MLEVKNLTKTYNSGSRSLTVLDDVSFKIEQGETFSIVGPSGSGKTTLLGLCAGLDRASDGSVILNGIALDDLSEDERASVRNQHVGFIFQNFQLIPTLTALENVMIPMELRGENNVSKKAATLLERVGLGDRKNHYPTQLSGGEQQRVSLARAFSNNPKILFADEPTGNLDEETSQKVEALLYSEYRFWDASFVEADTLEELVEKLDGVDKTQALKTLQEYNAAVDKDRPFDPTILDGKGTKGLKLNKTNWANTFDTPPFKAYPVTCGITFTYGGLKVNENAAVLNEKDKPIEGLYACGELVGGVFYNGYPGGSGLTSGAVFGRLAGYGAAQNLS